MKQLIIAIIYLLLALNVSAQSLEFTDYEGHFKIEPVSCKEALENQEWEQIRSCLFCEFNEMNKRKAKDILKKYNTVLLCGDLILDVEVSK